MSINPYDTALTTRQALYECGKYLKSSADSRFDEDSYHILMGGRLPKKLAASLVIVLASMDILMEERA